MNPEDAILNSVFESTLFISMIMAVLADKEQGLGI